MAELSLFQISREYLEIMEMIEENEGVLDEVDEAALAISKAEITQKSQNYIHVIKHCEAELAKAKDALDQIAFFKKRKQSVIDKLESNLLNAVKIFGPIEAGFYKISERKSEQVIITDQSLIPNEYLDKKVVVSADKAKLKKALNNNIEIKGAHIQKNSNLSIK